jgi:hypothetical protein
MSGSSILLNLIEHRPGDADPPRLGQRLDAGGDVHAIAEDVATAHFHVTEMEADAHLDAPLGRRGRVALYDRLLNLKGAAHRLQRAGEHHQETVADLFDFAPAVLRKDRPQQLLLLVEQRQRQRLVALRQRAVAHHVGEHDGSELAVLLLVRHASARVTYHSPVPGVEAGRERAARPIRLFGRTRREPTLLDLQSASQAVRCSSAAGAWWRRRARGSGSRTSSCPWTPPRLIFSAASFAGQSARLWLHVTQGSSDDAIRVEAQVANSSAPGVP